MFLFEKLKSLQRNFAMMCDDKNFPAWLNIYEWYNCVFSNSKGPYYKGVEQYYLTRMRQISVNNPMKSPQRTFVSCRSHSRLISIFWKTLYLELYKLYTNKIVCKSYNANVLNRVDLDYPLLNNIIFSNKSKLHLIGKVIKLNCRILAT